MNDTPSASPVVDPRGHARPLRRPAVPGALARDRRRGDRGPQAHRAGQLESVYQRALGKELAFRKIPARAQVPIAMTYKGERVGDFFADFIVDDRIVIEIKAVERTHGAHVAQVISYLRATELRLGLLVNFNAAVLYRGVRRIVL